MAGAIRIDDGVGDYHVARIRRASDELPDATVIEHVSGNREEDAPEEYTRKLESVAATIASRVQDIRDFALRNADALSQAVALLRERDQMSAVEARSVTALIDDIAGGAARTSSSPSPTPSDADADADADASRSGFGA